MYMSLVSRTSINTHLNQLLIKSIGSAGATKLIAFCLRSMQLICAVFVYGYDERSPSCLYLYRTCTDHVPIMQVPSQGNQLEVHIHMHTSSGPISAHRMIHGYFDPISNWHIRVVFMHRHPLSISILYGRIWVEVISDWVSELQYL